MSDTTNYDPEALEELKNINLLDFEVDKELIVELIHNHMQNVRDLPTLPTVAQETRRLVDDQKSNITDLVEIIEEDLALSGRILRIANSAYYGVPRKIDNLKMAMVVLGMNEINNLVTTVSIMRLFEIGEDASSFNLLKFWQHCAICAELTTGLYVGLRQPCPGGAYLAGLFHDVGKLFMDQYFHSYFDQCMKYAKHHGIKLAEAEMKLLGVDHGRIGSWLVQRWNLPDDITNAIAHHHFRDEPVGKFDLAVMIDWADRLSYLLDNFSDEKVKDELLGNAEWTELHAGDVVPLDRLVPFLRQRVERSLKLFQLLK